MDDDRTAMWANFFASAIENLIASEPPPDNGTTLRNDDALIFRRNTTTLFDIAKGE